MLNQIDPVVENSPVPTGSFEDFPSPQKSFLKGVVCYTFPNKCNSPKRLDSHSQLVFSKFYHKSEALRPLVYGILTLADNAGDYSQNDKGGRGDA